MHSSATPIAPTPEIEPSTDMVSTLGASSETLSNPADRVTSTFSGLLMPWRTQTHVRVTETVFPQGGRIVFGGHRLEIPPGALPRPVAITAEALPEAGNAVRWSPEGLRFAVPAPLHPSYANCQYPPLRSKLIANTDDLLRTLERLNTTDLEGAKQVTADLRHFSNYPPAW